MSNKNATTSLHEKLTQNFSDFTKAEKEIAHYMLMNFDQLAFETGASIAETVGVSQMTVGRFMRRLGYQRLNELKQDLRQEIEGAPVLVSNRLDRLQATKNQSRTGDNFELEVSALQSAYNLRNTATWEAAIGTLVGASKVHVVGFQTIKGVASSFATRLSYLRDNVYEQDGTDGTFSGIFAGNAQRGCIVLFEMRRYTQLSHTLLTVAARENIPIILICDSHCYWARDYTDLVFPLRTDTRLFWDSHVPYAYLSSLLLDDIVLCLGDALSERLEIMRQLQDSFGGFQD